MYLTLPARGAGQVDEDQGGFWGWPEPITGRMGWPIGWPAVYGWLASTASGIYGWRHLRLAGIYDKRTEKARRQRILRIAP